MQPTPEAQAFVDTVSLSDDVNDLVEALRPALAHEADLRKAFAVSRRDAARNLHTYAGLVDLFADDTAALRITHAREVKSEGDVSAKHVMPLKVDVRRTTGEPAMIDSLQQFHTAWSAFSEESLGQLGQGLWENVIVAGGSVLACLLPLPESVTKQKSKRALRDYLNQAGTWAASDIDVFLWGLSGPEEAEKKCIQIYEAVKDSVPYDVICVRTKHAITIHSQFPFRSVQIVLRLYASPAEILAGFDIDCACVAYDGSRVWGSPRAIIALMRQCNTIDVTRRSPSYEVRLAKYQSRGFEIAVPNLRRAYIDETIFQRPLYRTTGLARLLALENMATLHGYPFPGRLSQREDGRRPLKGDIKSDTMGVATSSYEYGMFHVPYGPGFDAARISRLIHDHDVKLNSARNPKNEGRPDVHRHPAFCGSMVECLEACCKNCPCPVDDNAKTLQATEDEVYVRGRVRFIEDDPGQQGVGSFRPLNAEDWEAEAYIAPLESFLNSVSVPDIWLWSGGALLL